VTKVSLRRRKRLMLHREAGRSAYEEGLARLIAPFVAAGVKVTVQRLPLKPTCGAKTRVGIPCRAFALANGRCRLHGGLSTGPLTKMGWARTRAGYRAWLARKRAEKC